MRMDNIIFEYRKKANLTQEDLAEKMDVSSKTISRWEKGISTPDVYALKRLSNVLDIPMDTFFNEINKIDVTDAPINVRMINRFVSCAITAMCLLLISYLFIAISYEQQTHNTLFFDIVGISAFILILVSVALFMISSITFHNNMKYTTKINVYKKHLYTYMIIYLICILPFIIFFLTAIF